jgi:hypothetical protein
MRKTQILVILTLLGGLLLTACGGNTPEGTPTLGLEQLQTAAVETFAAIRTQTAQAAPPTSTPTVTITPLPTFTPFATLALGTGTPRTNTPVGGGSTNTCNKLLYVSDVTIPDNTVVTPGQTFTKTWRVQNTGTCAWAVGYKFSLIGGDAMGGATVTLSTAVSPGAQFDIAIAMTAPTAKTGTIKGTWRMSDTAGAYFGDALTVVVVIGGTSTPSRTPTATQPTAYP